MKVDHMHQHQAGGQARNRADDHAAGNPRRGLAGHHMQVADDRNVAVNEVQRHIAQPGAGRQLARAGRGVKP